jgi:hypothetical protein
VPPHVRSLPILLQSPFALVIKFSFGCTCDFGERRMSMAKISRAIRTFAPRKGARSVILSCLGYLEKIGYPQCQRTEEIVLQICQNEGLQQVIWISEFLSDSEESNVRS